MKKNLIFRVTAILIGVTAGFAVAEFIAREKMPRPLYFPRIDLKEFQWKEYNGVVLWNQRRENMENPALEAGKRGHAFRIVGVGDSIMFGSSIEAKDTYMSRLGSELEKITGKETAVVDLSQPGYCIKQEAAVFDFVGVRAKPHLLIIHAWYDDLSEYIVVDRVVYNAGVYTTTGVVRSIHLPFAINQFLILNSRLYQFLSLHAMKSSKKTEENNSRMNGATFTQSINLIYEDALKSDAKILILLSPPLGDGELKPFNESGDKLQIYQMIIDWSRERRNVEVLDLGEKMAGINGKEVRVDSIHFNKKGHEMILKMLAEHISNEYMKK